MKPRRLILLLLFLPSLSQASIDKEVAICAVKEGDLARLACYDEIAKKYGLSGPQVQPTKLSGTGKWRVSAETNPIDDSKTVSLVLISDSGRSKWGKPVAIIIRCMSNKTELYINWNDYLGSSASVLTRIGKNRAVTKNWSLSTDSQATFYPTGTINFIKEMMDSNKLVAQVTPYNESPVTAIFDTTGLSNAIKPLRETCSW